MEIFGFELKRKKSEEEKDEQLALGLGLDAADAGVVITDFDNGYTTEAGHIDGLAGGVLSEVPADEIGLINTYRTLALSSEVDEALNEIRNEVFIFDVEGKNAFDVNFKENEYMPSAAMQKRIIKEVSAVYDMLQFDERGIEFFNSWYIDSRLFVQKIVDKNKPKNGVRRVHVLDPLKIRRVKFVHKDPNKPGIDLNKIREWYFYAEKWGQDMKYGTVNVVNYSTTIEALRINPDSVAYAPSGLRNLVTGKTVGYLNKAIVPFNNLKMMEDSMVIFRVVRAPQRRAIYVDIGSLQKNKGDEYMRSIMAKFKKKITYDSSTGSITDRRNVLSMLEDYWLPRRDGSRGTEIQTLEGKDVSGVIEEVEYYRDKLWRALGVPRSRFGENSQSFMFGKGIEIQRDEYRFKKFLNTIRRHFMVWIEDILKTNLVLKSVISEKDWSDIRKSMYWTFAEDNAFVEYKESEILNNRIATLQAIEPYVGKYFSIDFVRRKVLHQNDAEMEEEKGRMDQEEKEGLYDDPIDDDNPSPVGGRGSSGGGSGGRPDSAGDGGNETETVSKKKITVVGG